MKVSELDFVFISFDEPNAEVNYADLCTKVPWAKRIHGVEGSDAAHKAAANLAETEWFVTVDGDNQIYQQFLNIDIDEKPGISVYSWCGKNIVNGLKYGNGGLKIWNRDFVLNMKTHENAESDNAQIEFCWEDGYKNFPTVFSDTIINSTPYQAWRAGFREGVKMLTDKGVLVKKHNIHNTIWWHNIHRLRMWSCVGSHVENGVYAMLGARQGSMMSYDQDWDYTEVRDFSCLETIYNTHAKKFEGNTESCVQEIITLGKHIKINLGLHWAYFDPDQSQYILDLYEESVNLGQTYFNQEPIWKNSF
jgi:hypothetical protein